MTPPRHPFALRSLAALAALAVAAVGGGVPMCVSLIARATTPCAMHSEHAGSPAHHVAATSVNAAPSDDGSCHGDVQSMGCAAGGACPSGGTGALFYGAQAFGVAAPDRKAVFAVATTHLSFVAPPLPPPPQA